MHLVGTRLMYELDRNSWATKVHSNHPYNIVFSGTILQYFFSRFLRRLIIGQEREGRTERCGVNGDCEFWPQSVKCKHTHLFAR